MENSLTESHPGQSSSNLVSSHSQGTPAPSNTSQGKLAVHANVPREPAPQAPRCPWLPPPCFAHCGPPEPPSTLLCSLRTTRTAVCSDHACILMPTPSAATLAPSDPLGPVPPSGVFMSALKRNKWATSKYNHY